MYTETLFLTLNFPKHNPQSISFPIANVSINMKTVLTAFEEHSCIPFTLSLFCPFLLHIIAERNITLKNLVICLLYNKN